MWRPGFFALQAPIPAVASVDLDLFSSALTCLCLNSFRLQMLDLSAADVTYSSRMLWTLAGRPDSWMDDIAAQAHDTLRCGVVGFRSFGLFRGVQFTCDS